MTDQENCVYSMTNLALERCWGFLSFLGLSKWVSFAVHEWVADSNISITVHHVLVDQLR